MALQSKWQWQRQWQESMLTVNKLELLSGCTLETFKFRHWHRSVSVTRAEEKGI